MNANCKEVRPRGRHGIVVFITAYGAKGRRIESQSFLLFFLLGERPESFSDAIFISHIWNEQLTYEEK